MKHSENQTGNIVSQFGIAYGTFWSILSLALWLLCCAPSAFGQVATTVGTQVVYDDNIYLENDRKRPTPFVIDNAISEDLEDGQLSVLLPDQADGDPDDDIITNVYLAVATDIPQIENYAKSSLEGKIGALIFGDRTDESRLTLDGTLDMEASELIIPEKFYLGLNTALRSQSNSVSVAEGTAAESTQSFTTTGRTGYRDEIMRHTNLDVGYTGSLSLDLGAWRFNDRDDLGSDTEGSDYHTHTGTVQVDYDVSSDLSVGIEGNVGTQLYLSVPQGAAGETIDESDSNRTNAELALRTEYLASQRLTLSGSAGIAWTQYHNSPEPTTVTIIGPDGEPITVPFQPADDETSFVFSTNLGYIINPNSLLNVGAVQTVATDIQGERVLTRSIFGNLSYQFTDRLSWTGAGTYVQFSRDSLSDSTNRWEANTSFNYAVTQNAAIVLGYNYISQDADDASIEDRLSYLSNDYDVNRVFIGINVGLVGVPL